MKTPTLFFSEKRILTQAEQLRKAASRYRVKLFFPVKSFAHPTFLKMIHPFVDGFAVNSVSEKKLLRGLRAKISFYQPGVSVPPAKFEDYEFVTLDTFPQTTDMKTVFMRFRAEKKSRFGLSLSEIVRLGATRLHFHVNDPNISVRDLVRLHQNLKRQIAKRKIRLESLNIGGGFQTFSGKDLQIFFKALRQIWGRIELIAEPGRYFTFGAGFSEATVLSVSDSQRLTTNFSFLLHARGSFDLSLFPVLKAKKNQLLQVMGPTAFEEDAYFFPASDIHHYQAGDSLIIRGISGYSVAWNHSLQGIAKAKIKFLK